MKNHRNPDSNNEGTAQSAGKKSAANRLPEITPQLLERLRDGDHDAFTAVYLQSIESIMKFLNLLLHSAEEAEEMAQHVFVYLWEHRERINPENNFKGYLYRITKSETLNKLARKKVERKYHDFILNMSPDFNPSPDDLITTGELALMVKISLDRMPEKQRRVFEMSRFEGKSTEEIAAILNISPSTVRVHRHAATVKLKELIALFIMIFSSS